MACYFLKRSPQNNETSRVYSNSKLTYKYHTSTSTNASAGAALGTPLEGPLGPFLRPQRDFELFLKINMINFWRPKFRSIWAQGKGLAIFHVLCFSASNFPPFPGAAELSVATFPVLWNEPNWSKLATSNLDLSFDSDELFSGLRGLNGRWLRLLRCPVALPFWISRVWWDE